MAHFGDNVHTKSFTPREYQVELLDAAKERNIIVCLGTESGKSFIAMKLIQEMANDTRRPFGRKRKGGHGGKNTLYLVEQKGKSKKVSVGLRNLTDLTISNCWCHDCNLMEWSNERWMQEICSHQVLVMGSELCYGLLKRNVLSLKYVNLLIMDQCHRTTKGHPYTLIMQEFYHKLPRRQRPRILGLTAPLLLLLGSPALEGDSRERGPHPGCLEARLERLEKFLDCTAETASDIVSLLRYCPRPRELVVEWSLVKEVDHAASVLSQKIESELTTAWTFLQDHRYDPMEIYQDAEFMEELSCIPDPKIDPVVVLKEFLHILRTLGPWCADRAALLLLIHLDKLKVKTPYERHFLLLCMMTTLMVKIRGICELTFQEYKEKERIYKFSSPKVLRFLEILREFLPHVAYASSVQNVCGLRSSSEIPPSSPTLNCDSEVVEKEAFQTNCECIDDGEVASCVPLGKCDGGEKIGCENLAGEGTLKELDFDIKKGKACDGTSSHHCVCTSFDGMGRTIDHSFELKMGESRLKNWGKASMGESTYSRERRRRGGGGRGGRGRGGRGRVATNAMWNRQEFPVCDSLCGIVFVDGRFTAKILYHLLNDLRRSDPLFAALAAQYTVGCSMPVAGETLVDPREAEAEYRKQEEVLKRFRTHECNLLIGPTGWALEDGGLELPRCNLVLRFDHDSTVTDFSPPLNLAKRPSKGAEGAGGEVNCCGAVKDGSPLVNGFPLHGSEGAGDPGKQNVLSTPSSAAEIKTSVGNEDGEMTESGVNDVRNDEINNSPRDTKEKESEMNDIHDGSDLPPTELLNKQKALGESSLNEAGDLANIATHIVNTEVVIAVTNNVANDECMGGVVDETSACTTSTETKRSGGMRSGEELTSENGEGMGQLDQCVVRRTPVSYHSYVRSRARARAPDAHHIIMAKEGEEARRIVDTLAHFMQIEEMLLRRCKNREPPEEEEVEADGAAVQGDVYCPATSAKSHGLFKSGKSYGSSAASSHQESPKEEKACVTLSTAIALVNRYCAKLPSDTFTRLTPSWSLKELKDSAGHKSYVCSLRLPINSPVKQDILGHRMASRALARRSAALEACKILHQARELDDDLMPVGKESFRAEVESEEEEEDDDDESDEEEEQSSKSDPLCGNSKEPSKSAVVGGAKSNCEDRMYNGSFNEKVAFDGVTLQSDPLGSHSQMEEGISKEPEEQSESALVTDNISEVEFNQEIESEGCLKFTSELQLADERLEENLAEDMYHENEYLKPESKEIKLCQSRKTCLNGVIQSNNFKFKITCDDSVEKDEVSSDVKQDLEGTAQTKGPKGGDKRRGRAEEEDYEEEEVMGLEGSVDRPRPGTTKRRQYYYKRTADALTDCRPLPMHPAYLYNLGMNLVCPLPDEQNTRGRRIHPPEDSPRGFGILTLKEIPKICAFPIFTRSGEVRVCLEPCEVPGKSGESSLKEYIGDMKVVPSYHVNGITLHEPQQILLSEEQLSKALAFLNYTFAGVLRLQRYLMAFDPIASENSYLIVPTMCTNSSEGDVNGKNKSSRGDCIAVDWDFVDLIYSCKGESKPVPVDEEQRQSFMFEASLYHDAVVMPWYRNQDQPQYFYVAEICSQLSPKSSFPGSEYKTFEEYYFKKYAIQICNREQPLLDVDHTSARLNFLTPRYVNRKGVALPTSSEETKRAKRESLEQKQILVPELCSRHPFPASLWRKAVCLPCILYRLNALLLADQLRARVARDINLGLEKVPEDFEWPPLDFGWSLADVLKKSKESDNHGEGKGGGRRREGDESSEEEGEEGKGGSSEVSSEESGRNEEDWMEIGTWSNEMAVSAGNLPPLPHNVTMVGDGGQGGWGEMVEGAERIRYGSPSIWKGGKCGAVEVFRGLEHDLEGLETTDSSDEDDEEIPDDDVEEAILIPEEEIEDRGHHPRGKLRIQFKSDYLAEAVEVLEDDVEEGQTLKAIKERGEESAAGVDGDEEEEEEGEEEEGEEGESDWLWSEDEEGVHQYVDHFDRAVVGNKRTIEASGMLLHSNQPFSLSTKVTQGARNLGDASINEICNDSLSEGNILCKDDDQSDSLMTSTENAEFITLDSLSDDDDIFMDILNEDDSGELEESDKKLELKSESSGLESPCLSASCSICSCRSSCSSCSSLIVSSDEDSLDEERTELLNECEDTQSFSFDAQPPLDGHPGPSPPLLLQALTMSNANDGINLERLETIGDSFLKYAITAYLYCTHHSIHEGKLSHLRSKQVSNVNLYRLGKRKRLGESMIAAKFEPHDNWLPPCYHVPLHLERALIRAGLPPSHWNGAEVPSLAALSPAQIGRVVREKGRRLMMKASLGVKDSTLTLKAGSSGNLKSVTFEGNLDCSGLKDAFKMSDCESSCLNENGTLHDTSARQDHKCCLKSSSDENVLESEGKLSSGHSQCNRVEELPCFVPYNLVTQQSIPDKSIADCVEALIGAYLIACGPRGALLFMAWLGIRVLPSQKVFLSGPKNKSFKDREGRPVGCMLPKESSEQKGELYQVCYGTLAAPPPPLVLSSYSRGHKEDRELAISPECPNIKCKHCLRPKAKCNAEQLPSSRAAATKNRPTNKGKRGEEETKAGIEKELRTLLCGLSAFEKNIGYLFRDRSLLLQALTHASYSPNRLTDCYQRLEFLGDAVLDYLITRHLYEDPRQHSPGALTDLRSALVNNTIFASLAVRHGFHRFFLHLSPGLHSVVERFVRMQASNGHAICEEYYLIEEEECEEAEDVEVPKALGDVFESVAGAIFLDSGMSLDAVWNVYYRMMKAEIEQFSTNVPKSPIRELLEMEPETAKFGKPEKLADGRRVRVTVEVFGKGTFKGIGRNYRIAKCTAAKCALRQLKKRGLLFPRKN